MVEIRPIHPNDREDILAFTPNAFEPIFDQWREMLGDNLFEMMFPDWRTLQQSHVHTGYDDESVDGYVALVDGKPAGFTIIKLNQEDKVGEIYFLVVHPNYQNRGVGTALTQFGLNKIRAAGMNYAHVGTGGDPAHAPARSVYEKFGFRSLPNTLYYLDLTDGLESPSNM